MPDVGPDDLTGAATAYGSSEREDQSVELIRSRAWSVYD